jgi:hypothetical protein
MTARTKPRPGDLVLVRWDDILDDPNWQAEEHPEGEVLKCESVGWVSRWGRFIVLVNTFGMSGEATQLHKRAGGILTIPKGVVTGFEVLKPATAKEGA